MSQSGFRFAFNASLTFEEAANQDQDSSSLPHYATCRKEVQIGPGLTDRLSSVNLHKIESLLIEARFSRVVAAEG